MMHTFSMKQLAVSITLLCLYVAGSQQSSMGQNRALNTNAIKTAIGVEGVLQGSEYKVTVPQNNLEVSVDGFDIIPPMGLGSWVVFAPLDDGVELMGDLVLAEREIGPVQKILVANGIEVTGLHNHFVRETPAVKFMHVGGVGTEESLARGIHDAFAKIAEIRGSDPRQSPARSVENTLDTAQIAEILGHEGSMNGGVYKVTIGRPDVKLMNHGRAVSTFMGFNTWASWQGTPERAAVAGDFAMLQEEVAPVIQALVESGIEVVAVHNHMVHEEPRIFFLHYWGVGPAGNLARGLRAALDQTGE